MSCRWNQLFALPGLMSRRSRVPSEVPSVIQSSMPWVPSLAAKTTLPFGSCVNFWGALPPVPGLMSFRR